MFDEQINETIPENVSLIEIPVIRNKQICFIRAKEKVDTDKKSYLRSMLIIVGDELITTNFADTISLLAEIQKFEHGNKQNTYTSIEQHNGDTNLKLKLTDGHIYISTSEALAILNMHKYSLQGISLTRIIEDELMLSAEMIATYLHKNNMLSKKL
jgi:hypothetical protein